MIFTQSMDVIKLDNVKPRGAVIIARTYGLA